LAALVDEGTEACAKDSNHARIAVRPSANAIVRAAILKAGAGAWLSALQPE